MDHFLWPKAVKITEVKVFVLDQLEMDNVDSVKYDIKNVYECLPVCANLVQNLENQISNSN